MPDASKSAVNMAGMAGRKYMKRKPAEKNCPVQT
jgi:hypothetical protein